MRFRWPAAPAAVATRRTQSWPGVAARYLFCFAVLPNLPFWLLARREGILTPGWFSLDGLLLGVAALYMRPSLLFPLFVADFLLDIADAICHTYGTGFVDVARSAGYISQVLAHAQIRTLALVLGLVFAVVALAWVWLRPRVQAQQRSTVAAALLSGILLWGGAAHLLGTSALPGRSLRSPAADFARAWGREDIGDRLRGVGPDAAPTAASATDQARPFLAAAGSRLNLVVVLVESWGEADAPPLRQALLQPFHAAEIVRRYQVRNGLVHFNGPTGDGILRELCDLNQGVPDQAAAAAPAQLHQCLPARLRRRGYRTLSMDSASSFWPGGNTWYRQFGFEQVLGYRELAQRGLQSFAAGPFRSIRDRDTAAQIPRLLRADSRRPTFLFYLTVSAHLPVHLPLPADFSGDCGIAATTQDSAQACGWFRIEHQTLAAVAAAAVAPQLPPTVFVVVGDHAPPFVDGARSQFSPQQVPYVILAPQSHPNKQRSGKIPPTGRHPPLPSGLPCPYPSRRRGDTMLAALAPRLLNKLLVACRSEIVSMGGCGGKGRSRPSGWAARCGRRHGCNA